MTRKPTDPVNGHPGLPPMVPRESDERLATEAQHQEALLKLVRAI